jgi:DNA invertase Pin-like site-specific DNA recombinase
MINEVVNYECNFVDNRKLGDPFGYHTVCAVFRLQQAKEGLARAKANGVKLGRKKGGKNAKYKLSDKEDRLIEMLCIEHRSKEYIAKRLRCSVSCLNAHIKRMKEK